MSNLYQLDSPPPYVTRIVTYKWTQQENNFKCTLIVCDLLWGRTTTTSGPKTKKTLLFWSKWRSKMCLIAEKGQPMLYISSYDSFSVFLLLIWVGGGEGLVFRRSVYFGYLIKVSYVYYKIVNCISFVWTITFLKK